jgi:hypothetical protein
MDAGRQARERKKRELLRELTELQLEEMIEAGDFDQTPHFGSIERTASELGKRLSREVQERAAREVAAEGQMPAACPTCGAVCEATTQQRTVAGMDGPIELTEAVAHCRRCRRSFFPSADSVGLR